MAKLTQPVPYHRSARHTDQQERPFRRLHHPHTPVGERRQPRHQVRPVRRDAMRRVPREAFLPEEARHNTDHSRVVAFCEEQLKKLIPEDSELWCEPEFRVEEGFPAEEIISFAETELPDLIVLGLPKDKDFSTHFQTGVTYKVVASAPCPVLTVRDMLK